MANASNDWSITYQYKQDLNSVLFNQINTKTHIPGVYNPNIFIKAFNATAEDAFRGIKLLVKKGTTFIFSNTYRKDEYGATYRYHRDWDEIDSKAYVIKCTALSDVEYKLVELTDMSSPSKRLLVSNCPVMAVVAYMSFNEGDVTNVPKFCLRVPSIFYDSNNFKADSNLTSSMVIPMEGWTGDAGDVSGIGYGNNFTHISYLTLGLLYDTGVNKVFSGSYIPNTSSESWSPTSVDTPLDGCSAWNANHIFTGRGLPEYDHEWTNGSKYLDFINSPYFNRYLLPKKNFVVHQGLQEIGSSDWKAIIGQYDLDSSAENGGGLGSKNLFNETEDSSGSSMGFRAPETIEENKCYIYVARIGKASPSPSEESGSRLNIERDSTLQIGYVKTDISGFKSFMNKMFDDPELAGYIPLDMSELNLESLMDFIKNKNFFEPAINKIRLDGYMNGSASEDGSGKIYNDADERTYYIPLALIFTGSGDTGIQGELTDKNWHNLIKKQDQEAGTAVAVQIKGFRPENILSYSDLLKKYINLDNFVFKPYQTLSFLG